MVGVARNLLYYEASSSEIKLALTQQVARAQRNKEIEGAKKRGTAIKY